ncbi:uncharacterized protein LOC118465270 [Anopheles albimanus]|uniref:Uncharacterized protein n=1 Tax=Anopheles albimanus TaxID=7167 RepID=A0A182FLL4_ANOAL|nr:uncharacterized protein LOC118465270 [Anopheles albimanus]
MDYLKGFYKNVGIAPVAELKEHTKKQRQLSRHEMRQSFRNLNDSDEENVEALQPPKIKPTGPPMGPPQADLERLLKFREQKRKLKQKQEQQPFLPAKRKPFVATISRQDISLTYKRIVEPYKKNTKKEAPATTAGATLFTTHRAPLKPVASALNGKDHQGPERIPLPKSASKKAFQFDGKLQQQPLAEWKGRTPLLAFRNVPPRVDCWWPKSGPPLISLDGACLQRPAASVSAKKPTISVSAKKPTSSVTAKKPAIVRAAESKSSQKASAKHGNATNSSKKPLQGKSQRKHPAVMVFRGTKAGSKTANGTSNGAVLTSTVRKTKNAFTFTIAPNENSNRPQFQSLAVAKIDELFDGISPIETDSPAPMPASDRPQQRSAATKHPKEESFWEPQSVAFLSLAETTGVAIGSVDRPKTIAPDESNSSVVCLGEMENVGQSKHQPPNDEPAIKLAESCMPKRTFSLNESFTVCDEVGDDEVFCSKTPTNEEAFGFRPTIETIDETVVTVSATEENVQPAQTQKRCSLVFTEQSNVPPTEPSMPSEHSADPVPSPVCSRRRSSTKRRSSVYSVSEQGTQVPEEVRSKTDFYRNKVQCELARLQTLCDEYGPYLESDELNEHCRGLLMAAQGQTNILINKKLTKFQELIGHFENNWTDRKVRKDDLDGFWQMVALDLENLDQRFEELRNLRANDWQPIVQEEAKDDPPAKAKKLQAGAGIRKREKKGAANGAAGKSSSVVAELIRKARLEQKKKKLTDLGELAETVTLVTTPVKRSQRLAETPNRNSLVRRSSICMVCTPTAADARKLDRSANKCGNICPETTNEDAVNLKPSLKGTSSSRSSRTKSVLFMDACLQTPESRRRQSTRKIVDTPKPAKDPQDEHDPEPSSPAAPKQTSQQRNRRKSIVSFTEQIDEPPTEPSKSNLRLEEADLLALLNNRTSLSKSLRKANKTKEVQMPEEVRSKTEFYKDKVQCELARLQTLCDEYGPHLESDELNEHCRGLLMAAQGQTNILINKKLTKFQELIGHFESNWTDRKVRKDDLDGFWQMVALDLENLDQRFEELRNLRANDWQPIVQEEAKDEPPVKVKKLQAGAGIRKREKKGAANGAAGKSSSVVAELIRKARLEQKKKKLTDLGELAETVTLVTTPVKRSQRAVETDGLKQRASMWSGFSSVIASPSMKETRRTMFPGINRRSRDNLKSILKTPNVDGQNRSKSVLFLDNALQTPQACDTGTTRTRQFPVTPKLRLKFNDQLELEHIDQLDSRTPSRLEDELRKRLRQSLLANSASTGDSAEMEKKEEGSNSMDRCTGTPRTNAASKRKSRRISRTLAAIFDGGNDFVEESPVPMGRMRTRASANTPRRNAS